MKNLRMAREGAALPSRAVRHSGMQTNGAHRCTGAPVGGVTGAVRRTAYRPAATPLPHKRQTGGFAGMIESDLLLNTDGEVYEAIADIALAEDSLSLRSDEDEDDYFQRKHQELMGSFPWYAQPSVLTLAIGSFTFAMSTILAEGSRQIIIYKQSCNSVADAHGICDPIATQELMSRYNFYLLLVVSVTATTVVGRMGRLADIHGRKPVLAALALSSSVGKIINLYFLSRKEAGLPFLGLLFGTFVDSICGGYFAFTSMAAAYVSDVLSVSRRTVSLSMASGAVCMGRAVGPLVSDTVLKLMGHQPPKNPAKLQATVGVSSQISHTSHISSLEILPLRVELVVLVLALLYIAFVLPESRAYKAREKSRSASFVSNTSFDSARDARSLPELNASWSTTVYTQAANFFRPLVLLTYPDSVVAHTHRNRPGRARACVMILVGIHTGCAAWLVGVSAILVQYGVYRFNWNAGDIGHLLSSYSLAQFLVLVVLSPFLNHYVLQGVFGLKPMKRQLDMVDFWLLLMGYFFEFASFLAMAQSRTARDMLMAFVTVSLASLVLPATTSAVSKFYPAARRAELFTALTMLISVMNVIVPYVVMTLYNWSLHRGWPSMVLYIHMGIVSVCFAAIICAKTVLRLTRFSTDEDLISTDAEVALQRGGG